MPIAFVHRSIMDTKLTYVYDPIEANQLRLLRFLPDEDRTSIVFETYSIDDIIPPYRSLSYAWASPYTGMQKSWAIHIGGSDLPALDSLLSFIQALRLKDRLCEGRWWIDSWCIDQTNLIERAQQVRLMQKIYHHAEEVVVWLGEESDNSDLAMDFIKLLEKIRREASSVEQIRTSFDLQTYKYTVHWKALEALLSRNWWSRVWTIQEFVIPLKMMFWCGLQEASKAAVCRSLSVADKCTSVGIKETLAFRYGFNRRRVWELYEAELQDGLKSTRSLLSLAAYFCFMNVTDDRDRLYGMMAMSTDGSSLLDVSYSLTCEDVYMRFTQAFIAQYKSLDIVCFASVFSAPSESTLPSWVPDWHWRNTFHVTPLMVSQSYNEQIGNLRAPVFVGDGPYAHYSASKGRPAVYNFEGSQLMTQGIIVDTIDGIAASKNAASAQRPDDYTEALLSPASPASSTEILKSVCRALVLNRNDRFLRHPMPAAEFYYDFVRLCAPLSQAESNISTLTELQDWYQWTKTLKIQGRSFESILRDSHQTATEYSGPPPNDDEFIQDSFIGMVSERAMRGDSVCVLYGCSVPVLLRRCDDSDSFVFVGECYLDGYMDGSALDKKEFEERRFNLQ
ncbi:hypothetical protein EKO04_008129 [Ascochyta lentis]|uniref:Heterokaryon incompatibility domain-containing protein n=1 Tax=Ascochyta lentis TaxID=205686 RepID=A0A8H7MEW4_9PLEO|nr:hypothetical protein EKO04_008129 [Ascochyta lentis]